jgi:predicted house-cleaning noncanonical NTP pyrophosphatase (MazG superfamily)
VYWSGPLVYIVQCAGASEETAVANAKSKSAVKPAAKSQTKSAKKKTPAKEHRQRTLLSGTHRQRMTNKVKEEMLVFLRENGGIISHMAEAFNFSRSAIWELRRDDPAFDVRFTQAIRDGIDVLEDEAKHRALDGTEKPVFYQGEVCGYIREKSDFLMALILKAHRAIYKDRQELSGPDGKPLVGVVIYLPDNNRSVPEDKVGDVSPEDGGE